MLHGYFLPFSRRRRGVAYNWAAFLLAFGVMVLPCVAQFTGDPWKGGTGLETIRGTPVRVRVIVSGAARQIGMTDALLKSRVEMRMRANGLTVSDESSFSLLLYATWDPLPEPGEGVFSYVLQFRRPVRAYLDQAFEVQNVMNRDAKLNLPMSEKTAQNAYVLIDAATWTESGVGATSSHARAVEQITTRIFRDLDVLANGILRAAVPEGWRGSD